MRIFIDADGCPVVDIAVGKGMSKRSAQQDMDFKKALEELIGAGI